MRFVKHSIDIPVRNIDVAASKKKGERTAA